MDVEETDEVSYEVVVGERGEGDVQGVEITWVLDKVFYWNRTLSS